jgi:hypothetical protein
MNNQPYVVRAMSLEGSMTKNVAETDEAVGRESGSTRRAQRRKKSPLAPLAHAWKLAMAGEQYGKATYPALVTLDLEPLAVPIELAAALTGTSITSIYVANSEGRLIFRKFGSRSLVDFASLREFVTSLPTATTRVPRIRNSRTT